MTSFGAQTHEVETELDAGSGEDVGEGTLSKGCARVVDQQRGIAGCSLNETGELLRVQVGRCAVLDCDAATIRSDDLPSASGDGLDGQCRLVS